MKRLIALSLVVLLLTACGRRATDARGDHIPVELLLDRAGRNAWILPPNSEKAAFLVLRSPEDILSYGGSRDPISSPFPPRELEKVNFDKEIAFFITRGWSPTSPHGFEVLGAIKEERGVVIRVKPISVGDKVLQAEDYRITMLKMALADLPSEPFTASFVTNDGSILSTVEVGQTQ